MICAGAHDVCPGGAGGAAGDKGHIILSKGTPMGGGGGGGGPPLPKLTSL